ncbi:hypothetical protein BDV59DRAFT_87185 [Aspergillus ambiguus]|uniref:ubiquitin-conjugating enzyme E2 n=1 Tax=Aspergillus ambiguus TaxID=176160 RepID=UPI003CCD69CE
MDMVDATRAAVLTSRKFDLHDICCLISNPALVGHVIRTHHDVDNREPLAGLLIVSHTSIPKDDEADFLRSGVPPKGYVLVGFPEPSQGLSLINEDDLMLVDRTLGLGQTVKRHANDTHSGTVISASVSCRLEPVAWRALDPATGEYGPLKFTEKPVPRDGPMPDRSNPPEVHDVPQSELVNHEEFSEGDYIIYRQKVGVIHAVERDAIILLDDEKPVSLSDPASLYVPMYNDPGKVTTLNFHPTSMPIRSLTNGGTIWTTRSSMTFPGQYAFTTASNMSQADRASLGYGAGSTPQGHVVATPPLDLHVDWLCPNVFAVGLPYNGTNTEILRASALQGNATKCDFGLLPNESPQMSVKPDAGLRIGDRVRFRDPSAAATKYPSYQHIPTDESYGYDINILRITSTRTEVTVQWQDGSITTESTISLHKFAPTDDELWPGSVVILKDGVESYRPHLSHAETSAPSPHTHGVCETLRARKVGVVQTVNSRERIACVRWYRYPDIELLHRGNAVRTGSRLGELGDTLTDVSLYELSSYPCMKRGLDDLVILAPETIHQSVMATSYPDSPDSTGPCQLSLLSPISFFEVFMYLEAMKLTLLSFDWFQKSTKIDTAPLPSRYSVHHDEYSAKRPVDFIGKIVSIDTNGMITVRLLDSKECRDVVVPFERILMVLDEDDVSLWPFLPLGMLSPDESGPFSYYEDTEHRFRERLYPDTDDEWITEDGDEFDDDDEIYDDEVPDLMDIDDSHQRPEVSEILPPDRTDSEHEQEGKPPETEEDGCKGDDAVSVFESHLPSSLPLAFSLLDTTPPSDHRFLSSGTSDMSVLRVKRIQKEFQIIQSSLPPGIFVRTWESRMDLARVLIIGPQGTPYEHAPFVFDLHFSSDFPNSPPTTFFHSWTNRQGQINPNLYEDGKICLSILGTWPTENPEEMWSPVRSTVLQILVSIMGLVLVKAPFYNEAGYEVLAAEDKRRIESRQYTERTFLTTRLFIQHALEHPVKGMEDVLAWHYLPSKTSDGSESAPRLLRRAIEEGLGMIEHHNRTSSEEDVDGNDMASGFVPRLSLGAVVMLRKHIRTLEKIELTFAGPPSS